PDTTNVPQGFNFAGRPTLYVPADVMRLTWADVPYSYWSSTKSLLRRRKYTVNQRPFLGYDPGELLYLGAKIQDRNSPPFPTSDILDNTAVASQEKLATFVLSFKIRQVASFTAPVIAGDAQRIWRGHNLAPSFHDGGWYGVVVPGYPDVNDITLWRPPYP